MCRRQLYRRRVPRWGLLLLLVVGVGCAGAGAALLLGSLGSDSYGWTAYSPLTSIDGHYRPFDPTWLIWRPRVGAALLAAGAGTFGAVSAALVLRRQEARARTPRG